MFFTLHILLMATASLCILAGVSAAIFFRKKKTWLKFHKLSNSFGMGAMTVGLIMASIYVSASMGKHINGYHQMVGLLTFMMGLTTLLLGFYQFKIKKNVIFLRKAHRWLGRFS